MTAKGPSAVIHLLTLISVTWIVYDNGRIRPPSAMERHRLEIESN